MSLSQYLAQSAAVINNSGDLSEAMDRAVKLCVQALTKGKPILVCGNGGSAADASHIAGELVGRFRKDRPAYRCIPLTNTATITAWANDHDFSEVFARQVDAYGEMDGVLIVLSTSGKSPNVLKAMQRAKKMWMKGIAFTGEDCFGVPCDVVLNVPSKDTALIQQAHMCLYHYLCAEIERSMS